MIRFRLDKIMAERNLTNKDVEGLTEISRNTIKALVANANTRIDFPTLEALCSKLGVLPGDLIEYIPNDDDKDR